MTEIVKRTQQELLDELRARFGESWLAWAFVCPSCGDVATGQDFIDARLPDDGPSGAAAKLGRECIGRSLGKGARGCDWAAYGLFRGPEFVILPNGNEVPSFPIAPAHGSTEPEPPTRFERSFAALQEFGYPEPTGSDS